MSEVKMCDRCSALIKSPAIGQQVKCSDDRDRTLLTIGNRQYDFDLCQGCIDSLINWFNRGISQNEQPG